MYDDSSSIREAFQVRYRAAEHDIDRNLAGNVVGIACWYLFPVLLCLFDALRVLGPSASCLGCPARRQLLCIVETDIFRMDHLVMVWEQGLLHGSCLGLAFYLSQSRRFVTRYYYGEYRGQSEGRNAT